MLSLIQSLDLQITNIIYSFLPHNQFFDAVFSFFSITGGSIIIWLIVVGLLMIFEEKRDKRFLVYFFISVAITSFLVNIVIKNIIQRPRPSSLISNFKFQISNYSAMAGACPSDYSFPSAHAATAFAAAAILSAFDKKRRYLYYGVALIISLSRLYLYCHFLSDVIVGALFGYFVSWTILHLKKTYKMK